jgi:FHA domain
VIVADVAVETVLLVLKVAFLVLLYLFIWRIVRTAARDLRLPQESFVLSPSAAASAGLSPAVASPGSGRLVVLKSPALEQGLHWELDSAQVTIGRAPENDIQLGDDDFASARHARLEPRRDGVWLHDLGSTNGTFLNGAPVDRPRKLTQGDVVRVGETDLRFE